MPGQNPEEIRWNKMLARLDAIHAELHRLADAICSVACREHGAHDYIQHTPDPLSVHESDEQQ